MSPVDDRRSYSIDYPTVDRSDWQYWEISPRMLGLLSKTSTILKPFTKGNRNIAFDVGKQEFLPLFEMGFGGGGVIISKGDEEGNARHSPTWYQSFVEFSQSQD